MKQREQIVSALICGMASVLTVLQIALTILFYSHPHLSAIRNAGWVILWLAGLLGVMPIFVFHKKGGVVKGQDYTHTTVLVDSGIYAVIRHPQYLSFMLINLGLVLIAQNWLTTALGLAALGLNYGTIPEADRAGVEKFGDEYKRYIQTVPRINIVAGVIRLARRRRRE